MDDMKNKSHIRLDNAQLKTVRRYDKFGGSTSVVKTDEGFLRVQIRATRTGVFSYLKKDGSISRELRHPDDVFHADSLATLAGKPITLLHPVQVNKGLVNSKNFGQVSVGLTGDQTIVNDNAFVDTTGTITNEKGVREIEKRIAMNQDQEVSCGYKSDMVEESGVYNGEAYDRRQVNIRYNHIALVPRGRAGNNCKLRLDDDEAIIYDKHIELEDPKMEMIKIDGQDFEVSSEIAKAFLNMEVKNDALFEKVKKGKAKAELSKEEAEEEAAKMKKKSDKSEAKADGLEEENKKLKEEASTKMDANTIDALVETRTSICETATSLVKEFKKDGLSNLEIKKLVITSVSPDVKLDEKSEDYIDARFDGIVENKESYSDKLKIAINNTTKLDVEGNPIVNINENKFDSAKARENMLKDSRNGYLEPLSTTRD